MKLFAAAALSAIMASTTLSVAGSIDTDVEKTFAELRTVRPMQPRTRYSLPARGVALSGSSDDFLRRRTAEEIKASALSCGCGDYAAVFSAEMQRLGYETLLIDSAQISFASLVSTFSGHAVVAIRRAGEANGAWWLVDSTARKILLRDWSPAAKSFAASGFLYWIGYCGPAERYPVRSPDELKRFYAATLATVPREILNQTLPRLTFTLDASLLDSKGQPLNPHVERLDREQNNVFARYHIAPEREVHIVLKRGGDDAHGKLEPTPEGWVAHLGLKSACSPSFLTYLEGTIRRHETAP